MDKQLIERLAMHAASRYIDGKYSSLGAMIIDVVERIDAERGKEAFGYIARHAYSWSKEEGWVSIGAEILKERQQDDDVALFLAPQIPEGMAWQPIETAPKDGTTVLLSSPSGRIADGCWHERWGVWSWPYVMVNPTHWMPCMKPPAAAAGVAP